MSETCPVCGETMDEFNDLYVCWQCGSDLVLLNDGAKCPTCGIITADFDDDAHARGRVFQPTSVTLAGRDEAVPLLAELARAMDRREICPACGWDYDITLDHGDHYEGCVLAKVEGWLDDKHPGWLDASQRAAGREDADRVLGDADGDAAE